MSYYLHLVDVARAEDERERTAAVENLRKIRGFSDLVEISGVSGRSLRFVLQYDRLLGPPSVPWLLSLSVSRMERGRGWHYSASVRKVQIHLRGYQLTTDPLAGHPLYNPARRDAMILVTSGRGAIQNVQPRHGIRMILRPLSP